MKKLVLLVIVLAICMPGYGEVLVYKYSANFKMIQYINPNRTVSQKSSVTEKISAYVVFNIDSNTPLNAVSLDAGNKPTAILFGKSKTAGKWKKTIGGENLDSFVFIKTAESNVLDINSFNTYTVAGKTEQRNSVEFTFIDENETQPFEIIADMTGKASKTGKDLFPETIFLPWNLSGIISMTSGDNDTATFVTGQCTGTMKINFPYINKAEDEDLNVAETVSQINNSQTLASYPDLGTAPIPVP